MIASGVQVIYGERLIIYAVMEIIVKFKSFCNFWQQAAYRAVAMVTDTKIIINLASGLDKESY